METKYLHFLGAESNDTILSEIYGLETAATLKSKKLSRAIAPKICPQCSENNIPDSKFCAKCRMVLTYDAYQETIEEQKSKDSKLKELEDKLNAQQKMQEIQQREQAKMQEVQQKLLESIAKSMKITGRGGDMDRETLNKSSVLYTDERYKRLNMTQEQYQLATERLRQENEEAIHNTLLPEIANIAKGLQDNDIAAAKAAAKRILESKDFNEKAFLV